MLLLLALIAAAGIAFLLYFRNKENKDLKSVQLRVLMALRFFSFFTISFLLLSPFIKNLKKMTQHPVIITAWDNSSSLKSTPDSLKIETEINRVKSEVTEELGKSYSLLNYSFGESAEVSDELDFSEKKSDYSSLISTVSNQHFNENVGALIIAGDGIYNQGKNPVNLTAEVNFPIYTIGFGDTTEIIDSRIQNIRANRTSFSGNKFPVEVDAQFLKLRGIPLQLSIIQNNEVLESVVIAPPNQNYFYSHEFILDAGEAGLKHYSVRIQPVENEQNTKNNTAMFVINVLENKQKVLILSDGSHPDVGAIKNTLDLQKTYDVSVFTEEPYPSNLSGYNLLVLNQLPTTGKSAADIIKNAETNRIPILFLIGNRTFLPQLNALNQGIRIMPLAGSGEEAQATFNSTFAIFNLSEGFKEALPKFPPLQVAFADYDLDASFTPLFYQKIMNIETTKPLMAAGMFNGRKTGFIFGEGIWRWRLYDFYLNQNQVASNELINQFVQYLALRENEDNFIIDFNPVYPEIDEIIFTAEVYNDAFERVNTAEVTMEIRNSDNQEFNYTFDLQGDNYFLNTGHLPTGDYTFSAYVNIGNETYNESGRFTVTPVNFENIVTKANFNVLYQLAVQSGGKFYLSSEVKQLFSEIANNNRLKSTSYYQEMIRELLDLKWIFFVVLLLLSIEWFLRKFWGIY